MKRMLAVSIMLVAAAGVWRASESFRSKHPVSGLEITVPGHNGPNAMLVNGWRTTPAGRHLESGDMILSGQVSPDGKLFAFTNSGYTAHALHLVDVATEKEVSTFPMEQTWSGLAFAPDGRRIYVSTGGAYAGPDIRIFDRWDQGGWQLTRGGYSLRGAAKDKTAVAWLGTSADGALLYALNNSDDHLYVLETHGGRSLSRLEVGDHPIAARLSKDGRTLYVANLGSADIALVDVADPRRPSVTGRLATEAHPNDLAITADGRLFVSSGHTNSVVGFDLQSRRRLEVINTALGPKAPAGSTPFSLALSPTGDRLYVANADNNSVSVVDIAERGKSRPLGFLPTGWYPTFVSVTPDGTRLIVASGKGVGTGPNLVKRPIDPVAPSVSFLHHGHQLNGLLSFVDTPDAARLASYTRQVYDNSPYRDSLLTKTGITTTSILPAEVGQPSPIRHVLLIMKENRTYDQVLGDLRQGNGDPTLTLFGREVTPNQHALAEQFVLLDNLYCSGEVSQDGWPWTMAAYANEFTQRAWTVGYSRHGKLDAEGDISVQSSPYIWELVRQKGLTARTYGMGDRRGVAEIRSAAYDERPVDPEAPRPRDTDKAARFIEEFRAFDRAGTVPDFMFMSLGEDHTNGTSPGAFTPKAQVASNDLAVGRIVEAITKSKVWPHFAVFIIQDDAQNGPDHVDSHRTVGQVISPYTKRRFVDSDMYATVSMLRTIELLLGLPPMTQHDAAAPPMANTFMTTPDLTGFTALGPQVDLNAINPPHAYGATLSARMDFSEYDRIDEDALNRILWHSIKGAHMPYPAPVRRALPTPFGLFRFRTSDGHDE